ncbi:MAG: DUF3471 domain-containing protein, partial [Acidobacteriota bacterium]|nr:DUF3471 domain-containing protein [Acidobacteriota bacterium]
IPEEKLGVVVLTNMGGSILPMPLAYKVFDAYLGAQPRDWSADMLKTMKTLQEQGKAANAKMEAERVKDTKPSLALEKYAGEYQSEMYGDSKITFENGKLTLHFGPNFTGELEHWHYDVFRVTWRDRTQGKGFVSFRLDRKGKVEVMNVENIADFNRKPEKTEAASK